MQASSYEIPSLFASLPARVQFGIESRPSAGGIGKFGAVAWNSNSSNHSASRTVADQQLDASFSCDTANPRS